jgi:hypothetical protein
LTKKPKKWFVSFEILAKVFVFSVAGDFEEWATREINFFAANFRQSKQAPKGDALKKFINLPAYR